MIVVPFIISLLLLNRKALCPLYSTTIFVIRGFESRKFLCEATQIASAINMRKGDIIENTYREHEPFCDEHDEIFCCCLLLSKKIKKKKKISKIFSKK